MKNIGFMLPHFMVAGMFLLGYMFPLFLQMISPHRWRIPMSVLLISALAFGLIGAYFAYEPKEEDTVYATAPMPNVKSVGKFKEMRI